MPAIYLSYEIEQGMTLEEKQNKLYLGVISAGEQAYTLGAAIAECRKQLTTLDELVTKMRKDYELLKNELHALTHCPRCKSKVNGDGICQNYGCEGEQNSVIQKKK